MKRSFQSGAAKRREKKERLMREEKGKRTLHDFLKGQCESPGNNTIATDPPIKAMPELPELRLDDCEVELDEDEGESSITMQDNPTLESIRPEVSSEAFVDYGKNVLDEKSDVDPLLLPQTSRNDFMDTTVSHGDCDPDEVYHDNVQYIISNDPAKWKSLDKTHRELIVLKGPPTTPTVLPRDTTGRPFPNGIFFKHQTNGESVRRDWLVWSEEAVSLFCFPCTLFKDDDAVESSRQQSQLCQSGFSDKWKKLYEKVKNHESSASHLKHYIQWKDLRLSLQGVGGIDAAMQQSIKKEEEKWRKILKAVIDVVLFLAKRNLPLRGSHSTIDCYDSGLFLATLQLIGRYNVDVDHHLQSIVDSRETGKRLQAHYLSWQSQNEFLELCANEVRKSILEEVKSARYYSIIVDGTPDVSHKEQLALIIRYVLYQDQDDKWEVHERFIMLSDFEKKTGAEITEHIKSVLNECQLELSLCRGQGYDNASNMSGKFKGVQRRILEENPQAYFTPCSAHTLNLCGTHAMETSTEIKTYFGNVQKLYNIFSSSLARWKILQDKAGISLHSMSKTRWSARIEAINPLAKHYNSVLSALNALDELELPAEVQADVNGLIEWMSSYEFVLYTTVWYKLLKCIDIRNKLLQSPKLSFPDATSHIKDLIVDIELIKGSWDKLEGEASNVARELGIEPQLKTIRSCKKKRFHDEPLNNEYVFQSPEERLRVKVFYPALEILLVQLHELVQKMSTLSRLYSPILTTEQLEPHTTNDDSDIEDDPPMSTKSSFTENEVLKQAEDLVSTYPTDLNKDDLKEELEIFYKIREQSKLCVSGHISSALDLINAIHKKGLASIFPQMCTALRLLIVAPVSVASGERAFSKLSLIKNRLRSTMSEDRLNNLMMLSIEHDIAEKLSFDSIIDEFARMKARKKKF